MRAFGILIGGNVKVREPAHVEIKIPESRLARALPLPGQQLDEEIQEVFYRACRANDLLKATELLNLATAWHARRSYADDHARRLDSTRMIRMHGELKRLRITKGLGPVPDRHDLRSAP